MMFNTIFITVGTTNFDKLLELCSQKDICLVFKSLGCQNLIVQCGGTSSDNITKSFNSYKSHHINVNYYKLKDTITEDITNADLVISHAGAGTCIEVMHAKKPLIVVVNDALLGNHQIELAEKLASDGYCCFCTLGDLKETLGEHIGRKQFKPYEKGNAKALVKKIDELMGF